MAAYEGLRAEQPLVWMRALRDGVMVMKSVKDVGFCLALYAKPDGTNARPGWQRLAWGSGCSQRTVIGALGELEELGLIYCVERGQMLGRHGAASNYTLTVHDELAAVTASFEQWRKAHEIGHPATW